MQPLNDRLDEKLQEKTISQSIKSASELIQSGY